MMSSKLLDAGRDDARLRRPHQPRLRPAARASTGACWTRTLEHRPAVYLVWIGLSLLAVPHVHDVAQGTGPARGSGRHLRHRRGRGQRDHRPDRAATRRRSTDVLLSVPETELHLSAHPPERRLRRHGGEAWGERKRTIFEILPEVQEKLHLIPGIRMLPGAPARAARRRPVPGRVRDLPRPPSPSRSSRFAEQLQQKAVAERHVRLPAASSTSRSTSRSPRSSSTATRSAALGLDLQQVGADLAAMIGGNYVNRFNIAGRSYKVIPQIQRVRPAQPRPAREHLRHRARTGSSCR